MYQLLAPTIRIILISVCLDVIVNLIVLAIINNAMIVSAPTNIAPPFLTVSNVLTSDDVDEPPALTSLTLSIFLICSAMVSKSFALLTSTT